MNLSEIAPLIVAIAAGLGSGLVGSLVGSKTQRRLFDRQMAQDRNQALWTYEMALRDESDYLEEFSTMMGHERPRRKGPSVDEARTVAYGYLVTLPKDLRKDLIDPRPNVIQTSFEAADHIGWLANRLRDHLIAESPVSSRSLRKVLRPPRRTAASTG